MTQDTNMNEFKAYEQQRNEWFSFFDSHQKIDENGVNTFTGTIDIKDMYDMFYKLDYQARKVRAIAWELTDKYLGA